MRKLIALSSAAALGLGVHTAAQAYDATASVTFTWGGHALAGPHIDTGWTSNGANTITAFTNSTYITTLGGYNSRSYYNSDFATGAGSCTTPTPSATFASTRKYGCRYISAAATTANLFVSSAIADAGPSASASGTLTVTDTTLTGTLTVLAGTDEPTGSTTVVISGVNIGTGVGTGFDGYNYRTADGSPFGNAWYGVKSGFTLTVALTGTFTSSAWSITGGTVAHSGGTTLFACQQGGFGGDGRGTLCTPSSTGGGFQADGGHLDWGIDTNGTDADTVSAGTRAIDVKDTGGATVLTTLSGVLASLTVSGDTLSTTSGEFRSGSGSSGGGCLDHIRYDGTKISCGTLKVGQLNITGTVSETVIPLPAAAWLVAPAVLAAGRFARRRKTPA
jgi:hypothetical protein